MARILPERDECNVDNGGCEQKCINQLGQGFECACNAGFKLAADKRYEPKLKSFFLATRRTLEK